MPYHTTINQTTAVRRAFRIQDVLPPGMGTIYAWDWAYVLSYDSDKKTNVPLNKDSIRFSYIGLANQITTEKRISQHISDSQRKEERGLYVALGNALGPKGESTFKENTSALRKSGNGVVEIVHVASLFDLGALETYLISQEKVQLSYKANNFADLIKTSGKSARGKKVGLNTLGGGQGDPLGEGTTTSPAEWILAAYAYFIESDAEILASRKNDQSKILLSKNKNDYGLAITELINKLIPNVDTDSNLYKNQLEKIIYETSGKKYKFIKSNDNSIDFKKTFEGSSTLQAIFSYDINGVRIPIDSQVGKKIALKTILDQDTLDLAPDEVKKILQNIKNDINKVKTTPIIKEGLEQGQSIKELSIKKAAIPKINNAYIQEISNFIKKEVVITAKGSNKKDVYTGLVYAKIEDLLKDKYPKMFLKNKQILSDRAYQHEAKQMRETGGFLTADSVAKILSILLNYTEVYYSVTGSAPSSKEIGQIIGEATKDSFGDARILQQLTKK
jgi:hypothetical protein